MKRKKLVAIIGMLLMLGSVLLVSAEETVAVTE